MFLSEQEFKDQAMAPHVVQNFLLLPMQRGWYNFGATLDVVAKDLKFIRGFIKTKKCNQYVLKSAEHAEKFASMIL